MNDALTGKPKAVAGRRAIPIGWPTADKERREALEAWYGVAMQVVHQAAVGFRLMAIVPHLLDMRTGTISGTNLQLASSAGGCSIKTISRDVQRYQRLGLFIVTRRRKKTLKGEFVEIRTLRLAYPAQLSSAIRGPA